MPFSKKTSQYEILVRFNPDGRVGAHSQEITIVSENGTTVSARLEEPRELSLSELQDLVGAISEANWFAPAPSEVD